MATEADLLAHFLTIEYYAGLVTGALVWKTVAIAAANLTERAFGTNDIDDADSP